MELVVKNLKIGNFPIFPIHSFLCILGPIFHIFCPNFPTPHFIWPQTVEICGSAGAPLPGRNVSQWKISQEISPHRQKITYDKSSCSPFLAITYEREASPSTQTTDPARTFHFPVCACVCLCAKMKYGWNLFLPEISSCEICLLLADNIRQNGIKRHPGAKLKMDEIYFFLRFLLYVKNVSFCSALLS